MKLKPRTALATDPTAGTAPEMKFAAAVGAAMEEFAKAGGSVGQTEYSLLRYAAQAHVFQGRNAKHFQGLAMQAFTKESDDFRAQAKKGQA